MNYYFVHRNITINFQCEKIDFVNEYTYLGIKVVTFKWDKQATKIICNQLRAQQTISLN